MEKGLETIEGELRQLLRSQPLGVLSTQLGGQPYASLIAFSSSGDMKRLYFATSRSTRKYAGISADSRVALLVDNRSNNPSDFRLAMAATATGKAVEIGPAERETALDLHLTKHPNLKDFVTAPSCALFEIQVRTFFVVTRFQDVVEVHTGL